jgi:hypothetical protein
VKRTGAVVVFVGLVLVAQAASLPGRWAARPGEKAGVDLELRSLVSAHSGPSEPVLVIGDGQHTGYFLRRPTVAVPAAFYTSEPWDEARIRGMIARYGVRLVVVSRPANGSGAEALVRQLDAGQLPAWLVPIGETPTARVYATR